MKKITLAENAGFCFGVQRAVEEAIKIQKQYSKKIYTLGPLIHNNDVVKFLEENNIYSSRKMWVSTTDGPRLTPWGVGWRSGWRTTPR